jgi:hypothetical protein
MHVADRSITEYVSTHKWWIAGRPMDGDGNWATRHRSHFVSVGATIFVRVDSRQNEHVDIEVIRPGNSFTIKVMRHEFKRYFKNCMKKVHKYWQHDGDLSKAYLVKKY